ncbi:Hypothetical protein PHPALM_20985 [Phytophthora palmivora]|uniref:Histidine kinase/HSP90-like ATPase domain-containing protein n=1 Tax=Phytophthora palmivora TaxID=4796 RepID=A0A2P4XDG4_9STRA|nr:Hypothetical protein PHPALM_20985 [Phytophthora palmivora]
MTASYALPDLETAIQQGKWIWMYVIYNAIDAHSKTIKLSVDVLNATFTAVDDGDGIQPDDLYKYIGECFASSRLHISKSDDSENKRQKTYGSRGAFLFELVSLATSVEIESRVYEHWTSYRKVFQVCLSFLHIYTLC